MGKIRLTKDELKQFKVLLDTLPPRRTEYNKWGATKELLVSARKMYCQGKPFFITGSVNAPYDGCFHEPQIWLVTPAGCDMQEDLECRTDIKGIVWPLYGSGQGVAVDTIRDVSELFGWLAEGGLPDPLRKSENDDRVRMSGTFDSFEVHTWGPVSELPPKEHYWAHAVHVAESQYDIDLPWKCEQCGRTIDGSDYDECSPHFTGYRGNGGIGVFMEGALCSNCFDAGCCQACRCQGGEDHEMYDPDVADHGASLCDWHAECLLKGAGRMTEEAEDLLDSLGNEPLELVPVLRNEGCTFGPDEEPDPDVTAQLVRYVDIEGPVQEDEPRHEPVPIVGASFDAVLLSQKARKLDVEFYLHVVSANVEGKTTLTTGYSQGISVLASQVARYVEVK